MHLDGKTIDVIKQHLLKTLDASLIIVFGSSTAGAFRVDSDIDLAFLSEKLVEEYQLFIVAQTLAELVGRDVDLIDLSRASTVLKAQILGKGEVVHSRNPGLFRDFQIRTFKDYALLNEERAEIMEAIQTRGYVYGG